jgi:hypothetical protein
MINGKKAREEYLSIFMFVAWILIALALIYSVSLFRSVQSDVRIYESDILNKKIVGCILEEYGVVKDFNLYSKCRINEGVINNSGYYINLTIFDSLSKKIASSFLEGPSSWQIECDYQKSKKQIEKNFAQCVYKSMHFFGKDGKDYELNLLTAVNR